VVPLLALQLAIPSRPAAVRQKPNWIPSGATVLAILDVNNASAIQDNDMQVG
jgi:hypothetical protein